MGRGGGRKCPLPSDCSALPFWCLFCYCRGGGVGRECKKPLRMVSTRPQVTVGGRVALLLQEGRDVWPCGPSREHGVESCGRCHGLLSRGPRSWPRGGEGGAGRRETCGHHGLCARMEGTEPCPRSSSTTTKTFSLTLSQPSGTGPRRFHLDG